MKQTFTGFVRQTFWWPLHLLFRAEIAAGSQAQPKEQALADEIILKIYFTAACGHIGLQYQQSHRKILNLPNRANRCNLDIKFKFRFGIF